MRLLAQKFFAEQPPSRLYHYTGIGALLEIVASRSVWATHAYYLGDASEILHATRVLRDVLRRTARARDGRERELVRQFGEWLATFDRTAYNVFVFSLSQYKNMLSQWRAYTPNGKGVCLGFEPLAIEQLMRCEGFQLARCLYKTEEHQALIETLVEQLLDAFRQVADTIDTRGNAVNDSYHGFLEAYRGQLLQVLAIIKHPKFSEEGEWRIVSPYFPGTTTAPEIKFREGASMLLPYIEVRLAAPGSSEPLFGEVVLGPSRDSNLSMSALSMFLSGSAVCRTCSASRIPYQES